MEYVVVFLCLVVFVLGVAIWELWKQVAAMEDKGVAIDGALLKAYALIYGLSSDVEKLTKENDAVEVIGSRTSKPDTHSTTQSVIADTSKGASTPLSRD